mgnify:CR=1 FL=1
MWTTARLLQNIHLMLVDVDAVYGDGLRPQQAEIAETLENAPAVSLLGVPLVGRPFRHVDVEARIRVPHRLPTGGQGPVRQGDGGVKPEGPGQQVILLLTGGTDELHVLLDSPAHDLRTVAVGHLVAKAVSDPRLAGGAGQLEQAAPHRMGAGVMVQHGRRAVLDAVDHADQAAVIAVLEAQGLVQPPPEPLQDLHEILRRCVLRGYPAGEGAVIVHVGVDEARQDQAAVRVDEPGLGISGPQIVGRPHRDDQAAVGRHAAVREPGISGIARYQHSVSDQQHSTGPPDSNSRAFACSKRNTGEERAVRSAWGFHRTVIGPNAAYERSRLE